MASRRLGLVAPEMARRAGAAGEPPRASDEAPGGDAVAVRADLAKLPAEGQAELLVQRAGGSSLVFPAERALRHRGCAALFRKKSSVCRGRTRMTFCGAGFAAPRLCRANLHPESHPAHRKRFPQTLSGFFNRVGRSGVAPCFAGFSGSHQDQPFSDPALSFSRGYKHAVLKDYCNGLLLCNCSRAYPSQEYDRVVYNPATERWRAVPGYIDRKIPVHLCFDPAVSSHFHLVALLQADCIAGLKIYSYQTGQWSHKETGWDDETKIASESGGVFLDGMLHLVTDDPTIVAVDMEGKTWRTIRSPQNMVAGTFAAGCCDGFICQTQGRLCYVSYRKSNSSNLLSGFWRTIAAENGSSSTASALVLLSFPGRKVSYLGTTMSLVFIQNVH